MTVKALEQVPGSADISPVGELLRPESFLGQPGGKGNGRCHLTLAYRRIGDGGGCCNVQMSMKECV